MKRYISNLLTALTGKNPYERELQQVRSEMREAALQLQKLDRSCQDLHRLAVHIGIRKFQPKTSCRLCADSYGIGICAFEFSDITHIVPFSKQ